MYPNQSGYPGQMPNPIGAYPHQNQIPALPQQNPYPTVPIPSYPGMPQPQGFMPQQQQGFMPQQQQGFMPQQPQGIMPQQQQGFMPQQQQGFMPQQPQGIAPQQPISIIAQGRPTLIPFKNFDASNDASALRKAMKGFGTDEKTLINILCQRSNEQRMQIIVAFKTAFGRILENDIRSETSGNFKKLLIALLHQTENFYASELHDAMEGLGTDEDVLIEVLCTLPNEKIKKIIATYKTLYNNDLEKELRSETSGNFKKLLTSLMACGRDESMMTNQEQAKADAISLKKAGIDKFGTDESEFNRILCTRNFAQLKLICQEYEKLTGNTLEKDIDKEFSGDIKNGLKTIVKVALNRTKYFAEQLHDSMKGLGTNDASLIRLVVTRCEIDLMDIKEEFARMYKGTLKEWIEDDTSGDYKRALLTLCGEKI